MGLNSAELLVKFSANVSGSNDLGNPIFAPELKALMQFSGGTVADTADIVFTDTRTVGSASNDDIDLAGVLTNAFGATITAVEIVGIIVKPARANTTVLTIGGGTNPWITMFLATGDGIKVFPGGVFVNFAPDASGLGTVTAGTGDILRIANAAGAAATYDIVILARSA